MVGVMPHFLQVIVLATHAQTLLGVSHTRPFHWLVAEDDVFELIHARVGKHQRRVIFYDHGRGRHDVVSFALEEFLE